MKDQPESDLTKADNPVKTMTIELDEIIRAGIHDAYVVICETIEECKSLDLSSAEDRMSLKQRFYENLHHAFDLEP